MFYICSQWHNNSTFSYRHAIFTRQLPSAKLLLAAYNYTSGDHKFYMSDPTKITDQHSTNTIANDTCVTVVNNLLWSYQWLYIPCDVQYRRLRFLCEVDHHVYNGATLRMTHQAHYCSQNWTYVLGCCVRLRTYNRSDTSDTNDTSDTSDTSDTVTLGLYIHGL